MGYDTDGIFYPVEYPKRNKYHIFTKDGCHKAKLAWSKYVFGSTGVTCKFCLKNLQKAKEKDKLFEKWEKENV